MVVDSSWLIDQFEARFPGSEDEVRIARAPGRVNLIGEHTDYSGGFVLPVAIGHDVAIAFRVRPDRNVRLYSCSYDQMAQFPLDDIVVSDDAPWSNYFRGVAWALIECVERSGDIGVGRGLSDCEGLDGQAHLLGIDAVIAGDVPEGAGLSSSAAFEVASAISLLVAAGMDPSVIRNFESERAIEVRRRIALVCQKAENLFVGVNCGIMDQMASCFGRADHAIYLDCRSLEHELVGLGLHRADVALVIFDTGVRRGLVDSEYNRRREEVEAGARMISALSGRGGIHTLRDIDVSLFQETRDALPPVVARRCEHVIMENKRVQDGVAALARGDLGAFGNLMWRSHESLRDLYEVSCPELDMAVEIARKTDGVLGARMTGAGFGGCTVSLVHRAALPDLEGALPTGPMRKGALEPRAFVADVVDGAGAE
ncbi:MAG: galactokinase [Firmicutes bacterium]|nr:galactokinase [Bacillota bacterium]